MTSPLLGSLAATMHGAFKGPFLDATLTLNVPGMITAPADPPTPTQTTYACKAIEADWAVGLLGMGLVTSSDIQVLVLAKSLAVEPKSGDRITIRGKTVVVVPETTS